MALFPRDDSEDALPVRYGIDTGDIQVDPWPFSVEAYANYLVGYDGQGYPARLDPVIIPYRIVR